MILSTFFRENSEASRFRAAGWTGKNPWKKTLEPYGIRHFETKFEIIRFIRTIYQFVSAGLYIIMLRTRRKVLRNPGQNN